MTILLVITVVREYCCKQRKLKETETEETTGFFVAFLSLVAFQLGGRASWALPPPWLRLWSVISE